MDVSVIVPIYNSKPYLKKCLSSLTCQKGIKCQFICVDDGSTDGSGDIVKAFKMIDSRFTYIRKKNEGVSCARNVGLDCAIGKYVSFLDSDDCLKRKSLVHLFKPAESHQCDAIKFNAKIVHGEKWMKNIFKRHTEIIENFSEKDIFLNTDCRPFIWCHFINRIKIKGLKIDTTLEIGEDQEFVIRYLRQIKVLMFTSKKYYIHHNWDKSLINTYSADKICSENIKMVKTVSSYISDKSELYVSWVFNTLYYSFVKSSKDEKLRYETNTIFKEEGVLNMLDGSDWIKLNDLIGVQTI